MVPSSESLPVHAAMVLAAGYGTRLRPLTEELPKPLVPLGDRSVLEHIVDRIRACGIERIVINTHHLPERYDEAKLGVRKVVESTIRGTAGGVAGAAAEIGPGAVLVYNGDILADVDWRRFGDAHRDASPFATLAVTARRGPGEGTVGMNADNAVVRLRNGRFGEEVWSADFVGVQLLSEGARAVLPTDGCLVGDVYLHALARGARLIVSPCVSGFVDIGTPQAYHASNMGWLDGRPEEVFCANDAQVAPGVSLVKSVVGAGAVVHGRGTVDHCVIWPGARTSAPLCNTIVLRSGKCVAVN